MWRLRKGVPPFEVVEGPMTGQRFGHNEKYTDIPRGHEQLFERNGEPGISETADDPDNEIVHTMTTEERTDAEPPSE